MNLNLQFGRKLLVDLPIRAISSFRAPNQAALATTGNELVILREPKRLKDLPVTIRSQQPTRHRRPKIAGRSFASFLGFRMTIELRNGKFIGSLRGISADSA